ncbi:MAG TPA: SDR family oxidoreductase [Myxococcales bacterium]|jgi:dTDP-4-dehydrorhamnose reductase|nr:SDR family oxidoreductase [Myxococcales bacterium]
MRILIAGASGLVGGEVIRQATLRGHRVTGAARRVEGEASFALDLTDPAQVDQVVADVEPEVMFVCSAWPHVDGCEQDPARSERENVEAVANVLGAVRGSKARVAFYSSDHVFDGSRPEHVETDPVHPLSVYARHKRRAEELLLERPGSLVVRTAWVFGEERRKKNFMYRVIAAARSGQPLLVPERQAGCPTWSRWLADATLALLERGQDGVIHLTGGELLTKAGWAALLVEELQLPRLQISEVTAAEAGQVAPRPDSVRLGTVRTGLRHPPLREVLRAERARFVSG